jgi:hypothetical protein
MTVLTAGRIMAAGISLATFVFLFLHDSWRADNLFLVPDLVLCVALLVSAVLPARAAGPALTISFAVAAGVFATSVASYAVRDELGLASMAGVVVCLAAAIALARRTSLVLS